MVERIKTADKHVTIGLVGKYVQLHDAYLSVAEALRHARLYTGSRGDDPVDRLRDHHGEQRW